MKKLSKEAEERLLKALPDIADLTNNDTHPNDAIAKVASDLQVPAGHVQILVNAYNTGRTTHQRVTGETVWDKAAEFPIADTEAILEKMYPSQVKTAWDNECMGTPVSADYNKPPRWVDKKEKVKKRSSELKMSSSWKPKEYAKEDNSYKRATASISRLEKELDEARFKANYAFESALELKKDLANYFKSANHKPFEEVQENSVLLYGDDAKFLFGQLAHENPEFRKQSSINSISPVQGEPYIQIYEIMEMTDAYRTFRDEYNSKEASFESSKKEIMQPFLKVEPDPVIASIGRFNKNASWVLNNPSSSPPTMSQQKSAGPPQVVIKGKSYDDPDYDEFGNRYTDDNYVAPKPIVQDDEIDKAPFYGPPKPIGRFPKPLREPTPEEVEKVRKGLNIEELPNKDKVTAPTPKDSRPELGRQERPSKEKEKPKEKPRPRTSWFDPNETYTGQAYGQLRKMFLGGSSGSIYDKDNNQGLAGVASRWEMANPAVQKAYDSHQEETAKARYKDKEKKPAILHDNDIYSLQQNTTLSDILAHDDVLSHHNPHEVLEAYNHLQSLAPIASSHPEILKSLLRNQVQQGGLGDAHAIKAIAELENQLGRNQVGYEPKPGKDR